MLFNLSLNLDNGAFWSERQFNIAELYKVVVDSLNSVEVDLFGITSLSNVQVERSVSDSNGNTIGKITIERKTT